MIPDIVLYCSNPHASCFYHECNIDDRGKDCLYGFSDCPRCFGEIVERDE